MCSDELLMCSITVFQPVVIVVHSLRVLTASQCRLYRMNGCVFLVHSIQMYYWCVLVCKLCALYYCVAASCDLRTQFACTKGECIPYEKECGSSTQNLNVLLMCSNVLFMRSVYCVSASCDRRTQLTVYQWRVHTI